MRRPCFRRWIRTYILESTGEESFNLRKLCARAQRCSSQKLAAALLLYAHENGCVKRFMSFVYDDDLRRELTLIEKRLGKRSVEQLALRGTPMRSLPEIYRDILTSYERAYHAPERIAKEKAALRDRARLSILQAGVSPAELSRQLDVDPANLSAFLSRGETHRVSLETARRLVELAA